MRGDSATYLDDFCTPCEPRCWLFYSGKDGDYFCFLAPFSLGFRSSSSSLELSLKSRCPKHFSFVTPAIYTSSLVLAALNNIEKGRIVAPPSVKFDAAPSAFHNGVF